MTETVRIEITAPVIVSGRSRAVGDVVDLHVADAMMFERTGRGVRTDKPLTDLPAAAAPDAQPRRGRRKIEPDSGEPANAGDTGGDRPDDA